MKHILTIIAVAVIALAIGYLAASYYNFGSKVTTEESSTVLLEKIKTVSKLVTIEGYFSEVWQTKKKVSYWGFTSESQAIIKVKGKVSVGYDLEKMKIESFPEEKVIRIINLPKPKIISVDHDLEYFSLEDGYFVSFTTKDMSNFNKAAKDTLVAAAGRSRLFDAAAEQGNDVIKLIELIAKDAGWTVEYETGPNAPNILGTSDTTLQGDITPFINIFSTKSSKTYTDDATHHFERYRPLAG